MNIVNNAIYALKMEIDLSLASPLLLRSGEEGEDSDSAIERSVDGDLYVNGHVWAGLLRRSLARIKGAETYAAAIGKYQEREGVSPLWCEDSTSPLQGTEICPGISIDRKRRAGKSGALYSDELAIAGLPLCLRLTFFAANQQQLKDWHCKLNQALRLIHAGIENIGGGWTYGYGRLAVHKSSSVQLDLRNRAQRSKLWQWDAIQWQTTSEEFAGLPETTRPIQIIDVRAGLAAGQLFAVQSSTFPLDVQHFGKLPDSFVYRRTRWNRHSKTSEQHPVIPAKAIRQALLSVPLERKWRSGDNAEEVCFPGTAGACGCRRCRWFGSVAAAGIVAVLDSDVENAELEVVNRVQLCEHSMSNINLFASEFLVRGDFSFRIIVDGGRSDEVEVVTTEICALLNEMMTEDESAAPPGWYRLGGTASCTGQIEIKTFRLSDGGGL
jgi:hypothetical protein